MHRPILLIEDNQDDIDLTLRAFKKSNIVNEIIVARDGEAGLDLLMGDAKIVPSVVLLDLKLPKIDGLEVLQRLRADNRTKLLPVVILTSSIEESDLLRGYELGANSYIRKPVDFNHFTDAVKSLGLYWLLINEAPPIQ
jgi:CheY-like chemotaxis protein